MPRECPEVTSGRPCGGEGSLSWAVNGEGVLAGGTFVPVLVLQWNS